MTSEEKKNLMELWMVKFQELGSIKQANKAAGVSWSQYWSFKKDPYFQELWEQRHEDLVSMLEQEAIRRAVIGEPKHTYFRGEVVGTVMEKDTDLLKFLLRAEAPEKYKNVTETKGHITHTHEGVIEQANTLRIELMNDPNFLKWQYSQPYIPYEQDGITGPVCTGSDKGAVDSGPSPTTD